MRFPGIALFLISVLAAATPAAAEPAQGYITGADSVRIHYLEAGPADAQATLLLIPGWRVSSLIWSKQLDHFSTLGYRVIAIDPRSQGGSSVAQSGNAPEDRARDVQAVIAGLKLKHLTLVGWSQGVQDVAAYVDHYGTAALERLVLVDSTVSAGPSDVKENPLFVQTILEHDAVFSRDPRGYSDGMLHAIITAPTPPETYAQLTEESMKTPPDVSISMLIQDLFTTDLRPALKKFDKPTLVIASAASPLLDAQRAMAAALPQGQFHAIEHAAHAVFFDQPEEFNRLLEAFMTGSAAPAAL